MSDVFGIKKGVKIKRELKRELSTIVRTIVVRVKNYELRIKN